MSKKLTELQAGAINAWTSLQQAALRHRHQAEQVAKDEAKAAADEKKKKAKEEQDRRKGKARPEKPEEVTAGKIVDDFVSTKPLHGGLTSFLCTFGPIHIALPVFIGLHLLYWWKAPYFLHWLLAYPTTYFVPIVGTLQTLFVKERSGDRPMWQAYWIILACVEYLELCLFGSGGGGRGLVMWPKVAMHIIGRFLPDIPKEKEKEDKRGDEKRQAAKKQAAIRR